MPFAELMVALAPLRIEEVVGGPVIVLERGPDDEIVVERDRIFDPEVGDGFADIVGTALERELRRVDADYDQAVVFVGLIPGANVRDRADAVDAAVGPEVDQDDLALELLAGQRRAVDPRPELVERRQLPFDWQLSASADLRDLFGASQP